jgi:nicotinamide-nucleotide amidase
MPPTNRIQAMYPKTGKVLPNSWGTAPGIYAQLGDAHVYVFPGVPREMMGMFEKYISVHLEKKMGRCIVTESVTTFGAGESILAQALGELMERTRNPLVGTTVSNGEVSVRIRSDFATQAEATRECEVTVTEVMNRLGDWVVGRKGVSLAAATIQLARERGIHLAVAESCTGGGLSALLTDVPGSSDVFLGGWVTYANEMKARELDVNANDILSEGAVSKKVCMAMAEGALKKSGADYSLAITGTAGPGGGSESKPVGTVWTALAFRRDGKIFCESESHLFPGSRDMIRMRAAKTAINCLRLALRAGRQ